MVTDGIARLCSIVVFPLVAAEAAKPRTQLRADLAPVRLAFVMICAFCLSIFVTLGDFIIAAMYDHRYQAAGWMLPVLVTGLWFSILASLNESILIGVGRPKYTTVASSSKLLLILVGLPLATTWYGISGAVGIIAFGDLPRYCAILFGQRRLQLSFLRQDAIATVAFFALILLWEYVRLHFHLGTSFDNIP
jgi:O-antigen/teichoic acid export membrane protein